MSKSISIVPPVIEVDAQEEDNLNAEITAFNVTKKQRKESVVHKFPGLGIDIVVIPVTPRESPVSSIQKPNLISEPEDIQIFEAESATFEFELENSEGVTLRWFKDAKPLLAGGRTRTSQNKNIVQLEIKKALIDDEALYECYITNEAGEIRCEMQLLVDDIDEKEVPPTFIKSLPSEIEVIEGEKLVLEVQVSGAPQPKIKWYFKGDLVRPSEYLTLLKEAKVYRLIINETLFEDEGLYKCVAESESGKVSTCTGVFVEEAKVNQKKGSGIPKILSKLKDVDAVEGETVCFKIQATGDPWPNAKWYVNGRLIIESPRIKCLSDKEQEQYSLVMKSVKRREEGAVKCILTNKVGNVTETCTLIVE